MLQPLLVSAAVLVIAACATPPAALRADTAAYLQKASSWAPVEAETARAIERILATEFVDEAEVRRQIADSSARVRPHLAEVERYEPRTKDIRQIHRVYLDGWRTLLAGYDAILSGFDSGEQRQLSEGRAALARWRDAIVRVARELRALSERLDLDLSSDTRV